MTIATIKSKFKEYKSEIVTLEKTVKKWKQEVIVVEIGRLSKECYDSFNSLQMDIAKFKDPKQREEYERKQYEDTYNFLIFVENEMNVDLYVLLVNNVPPFANLINHWSKYCSKMENKYNIELDSEANLRTRRKLKKK